MNCPFYGRYLFLPQAGNAFAAPFLLVASGGNQCALITAAYAPCQMEIGNRMVNWKECSLVQDIRQENP